MFGLFLVKKSKSSLNQAGYGINLTNPTASTNVSHSINENRTTSTSNTESFSLKLGGDYSCYKNDNDLYEWHNSLEDPDKWAIIEYKNVSSIFELLPQRYFQSIQALMVKNTTNNVTEINPLDKVLSYWTNKLCHGLTITEKALKCSNFKAI